MAEKENNYMQPSVPKFDGHYSHWAMLMENLLRSKEYWNLVEKGVFIPPANATPEQLKQGEESKLKDLKAKNYLFQAIDRNILETILAKDTAKEIWESMKKKYQGTSKVKRAQLQTARKELENLEMKEGDSIDEYFAKTLEVINRMKLCGEKIEQEMVVEKILRSLTSKFNYAACSIELSNDVSTLSIDELQSSLKVEEQRMKGKNVQKQEEQVLKVTNAGRGNRGRGRSSSRGGRGRGRQSWSKDTIECYNCRKLGHYQSECPNLEETTNFTEFEEGEEILLMAQSDEKKQIIDKVLI